MERTPKRRTLSGAKAIALVGITAATVECGKLALMALPNVEVVTLLIALYGYVFGFWGVISAIVFVSIEPLLYGFGTWVISYYIYWPLVALVFMLLRKTGVKNRWLLTAAALALTFLFGVLTSLVEVGLFSGVTDKFMYNFAIYYARGIVFYAIQLASNAVLFPLVFKFLAGKLEHFGRVMLA